MEFGFLGRCFSNIYRFQAKLNCERVFVFGKVDDWALKPNPRSLVKFEILSSHIIGVDGRRRSCRGRSCRTPSQQECHNQTKRPNDRNTELIPRKPDLCFRRVGRPLPSDCRPLLSYQILGVVLLLYDTLDPCSLRRGLVMNYMDRNRKFRCLYVLRISGGRTKQPEAR